MPQSASVIILLAASETANLGFEIWLQQMDVEPYFYTIQYNSVHYTNVL